MTTSRESLKPQCPHERVTSFRPLDVVVADCSVRSLTLSVRRLQSGQSR